MPSSVPHPGKGRQQVLAPYRVKVVVCASGERLPLLMKGGAPLFLPTVFAISQVRGRSLASATVERSLRAIQVLLVFAEREGIDLEDRVHSGKLLDVSELDRLAEAARIPLEDLAQDPAQGSRCTAPRDAVVSLEHYRAKQRLARPKIVADQSSATRLRYIRDYFAWLSSRRLAHIGGDSHDYTRYHAARETFLDGLGARIPSGGRARSGQRQGLSHADEAALRAAIDPSSPRNPWKDETTRIRNQLIVLWLLHLGIRRGELLSVRVPDIDFRKSEVEIVRRPDAGDDPRRLQPLVKTSGRALPLDALAQATLDYVIGVRRKIVAARKHSFLFVTRSGRPLTTSGLTKVFSALKAHPDLIEKPSPHVLRHTWNDRFSEMMDEKKTPEELEKRMRCYLQGWVPTSEAAAIYTRRHVRERARRASLELQASMMKVRDPADARS